MAYQVPQASEPDEAAQGNPKIGVVSEEMVADALARTPVPANAPGPVPCCGHVPNNSLANNAKMSLPWGDGLV
jgi:hypothetical protein